MKFHGPRGFRVPHLEREKHAKTLLLGLKVLGPEFAAEICPLCFGRGQRRQTYLEGTFGGPCNFCGEMGLMQGAKPAHGSVVVQVLNAAER